MPTELFSPGALVVLVIVVVAVASFIYYFFEVSELELGIPPNVKLGRRVRSRKQEAGSHAAKAASVDDNAGGAAQTGGVNVGGGKIEAGDDIVGGHKTVNERYEANHGGVIVKGDNSGIIVTGKGNKIRKA